MLLEILAGLISMILNPWLGMIFYKLAGFSFMFTFSILIVREIVYLILVYYVFSWAILGVSEGRARKWIEKIKKGKANIFFISWLLNLNFLQKIIEKSENIFFISWLLNFLQRIIKIIEKSERITEKIVDWIVARDKKICCILSFIPFIPYLPTAVTIAIKLMKVRYGFMILCLSEIFRGFVCCLLVYIFSGNIFDAISHIIAWI